MKKYISSLLILMVIFTVNIKTTKAENSKASLGVKANASVKATLRADIQNKIKELTAERAMIKTELKNQTEESKQKIQTLREEIKDQIQTTREEVKQKMEELKAQAKEEKDKIKANIEQKRLDIREKALEKFDVIIERIKRLEEKVNAQIVKFEEKGVDVTSARANAAIAETKLSEASAKVVEINALLSVSVDQLTTEQKATLKTLKEETQALVKEAHNALIEAVKALRASVAVKLKTEATVNTTETNQ